LGQRDGEWYFESHKPLDDDLIEPGERLDTLLRAAGASISAEQQEHARAIASAADGVPVRIAEFDSSEVLARARLVHNTIEQDPDAPTLEEVREMIDAAVAEARLEAEKT
jgi:hypothetical protein